MGTMRMWRPHGDNIETTWGQHEDNVETTWGQHGNHGDVETTWGQHGDHGDVGTVVMRDVCDKSTLSLALACCLLLKVLSETVQVVW